MASSSDQTQADADDCRVLVSVIMTTEDAWKQVAQLCLAAPHNVSVTVTGPEAHGLDVIEANLSQVATRIINVVMTRFPMPDGTIQERKFVVYIH